MIHTLWFWPLEKHLFISFVFGPTHARLPRSPREGPRGFCQWGYVERGSAGGRPGKSGTAVGQCAHVLQTLLWGSEPF